MAETLQQWRRNGWLKPHKPSDSEISDLMEIVDRDLQDAQSDLSLDWKFGIAYNAVLKLCTILLYLAGYKPERNLAHYRTLQALPHLLPQYSADDADFLDACRIRRNTAEYDLAGSTTQTEFEELYQFAQDLRTAVKAHLEP